jgi:prolyl oligopeptidase
MHAMNRLRVSGLSLAVPFVLAGAAESVRLDYPPTRRVDQVDVYHGVAVADPYRWLEADVRQSKEVASWVEFQNALTFRYLEAIPERERLRKRLTALWDYARYSAPFKEGGRYFFSKNDGLQNQAVVYVQDSLDGPARALIDPNAWSPDGTVALEGLAPSEDGRYVAYGAAEAGSDWAEWRVLEIESGATLPDRLRWTKFTDAAWTKDSRGFFYGRFDEPKPGEEFQALNLNQRLCYHRVGTPQAADAIVYARSDHPDWYFGADVTDDGRYLVITISRGTDDKYRTAVRDLVEPYAMPVDLIDSFENEYSFVGNDGPVFFFKTDLEAPRRRLVAMDLRAPGRTPPAEIIPQAPDTLLRVSLVGNLFVATYLADVKPQVKVFTLDGRFVRDVALPGIGTVGGFDGKRTDTETFYTFASFAAPPSVYRHDLITGETRCLRRAQVAFDPDAYETTQVFLRSKDGTRIPMFLTHRKGLARDGANPTLLYGYGGFNAPMLPHFAPNRIAWLELGGVYAVANLRGGGEYGEAWHAAGTKLKKQNVFDDFIAAAEWLIAQNYTRPGRLAIEGGSNGGLLVGAAMTQRPDLFGACLPAVGVMDMLRFHTFTQGRLWVDDYGSADDPDEFRALRAYSPYHALAKGVRYPATLVTTADTDDRVVPGHSFKFTAALQQAQAGPAPVLIRVETRAGHGRGKPTGKAIDEAADKLSFLVRNCGLSLNP